MRPEVWALIKTKKETPCCYQQVRVKIVEPGVQMRKCSLCGALNYFVLAPSEMFPGRLKFRWLRDDEVADLEFIEEGPDIGEL